VAVYREKRRTNRLPLVILGVVVVVLLGAVAWAVAGNRPAGETPRARVQAGLRNVSEALDLFAIEYPKAQSGQTSGAGPALQRARQALDGVQADLTALDPAAAQAFRTALTQIEQQAAARAPADTVVPAATRLRTDIRAWMDRP
jgi:hypothetical protein